jgi:hypothetical protein
MGTQAFSEQMRNEEEGSPWTALEDTRRDIINPRVVGHVGPLSYICQNLYFNHANIIDFKKFLHQ